MAIHTTDAIILRRYPYRETSVIVTCLTEKFGKIKGLIKGLRSAKTRHRSAMEALTINNIVFYDTRSSQLHLISQCELKAPLSNLQRDLETMRTAADAVHLVDIVVPLEEPQPRIYQLLQHHLEHLSLGSMEEGALKLHFIMRLLRLIGFEPQITGCTSCNTQIHLDGHWSAKEGGLLCKSCLHEDPKAEYVEPDLLKLLNGISESVQPIKLESNWIEPLQKRLDQFLAWHVGKTPRRPVKILVK